LFWSGTKPTVLATINTLLTRQATHSVNFMQRGREVLLLNLQYFGEELIVPSGALPLSFQAVSGGMVL
jgi:hypothetical protein